MQAWSSLHWDHGSWPTPWESVASALGGKTRSAEGPGGRPFTGPAPLRGHVSPHRPTDGPCFREDSRGFSYFYHILGETPQVGGIRSYFQTQEHCVRSPHGCPTHEEPVCAGGPQIWRLPALLPRQETTKEVRISHEEHAGPKRIRLGREQQIMSLPLGVRVPWAPPHFLAAHFPRADKSGKQNTTPRTLVPSVLHGLCLQCTGTCALDSPVPQSTGACERHRLGRGH